MKRRLWDAFDKIHAEQDLKKSTKEFLAKRTNGYRKRKIILSKRLIAVVSCFVLLLFAGMGYSAYLTPAYAISIDVNPSIELGINRFHKVISVDTYNEDGYTVMSAMNVYNLDYQDALELILTNENMKEYIMQNELIAVTVSGKNEDKNNELLDNIDACISSYANVHCSSCNSQEVAAAHEAGMSFGKYKAFLELQALDPDISAEDIQELTMCQIWNLIDKLSGNREETTPNDSTDRCGKGHHNGHGSRHGRGLCLPESNGKSKTPPQSAGHQT